MATNKELTGKACPVCGSPDRACGGHGPSATVTPIDKLSTGVRGPATVMARATVHGIETIFKTTPEEAEKRGWTILGMEALVEPEPETPAEKAKAKSPNKARSSSSARNTSRKAPDK